MIDRGFDHESGIEMLRQRRKEIDNICINQRDSTERLCTGAFSQLNFVKSLKIAVVIPH